jgi:LPS-assembly protein
LNNTGLESGLSTKRSDFVGRIQVQPVSWFTTTVRGRFDEATFAANRLEIQNSFSPLQGVDWFGDNKVARSLSFSATYGRIQAQPLLGQPFRREALNLGTSFSPYQDWSFNYSIAFDLGNHLVPTLVTLNGVSFDHFSHALWEPAQNAMTVQYKNDCCTFKAQYLTGYTTSALGSRVKDDTVLFTLELRTLGAISYSSDVTNLYSTVDGINTSK